MVSANRQATTWFSSAADTWPAAHGPGAETLLACPQISGSTDTSQNNSLTHTVGQIGSSTILPPVSLSPPVTPFGYLAAERRSPAQHIVFAIFNEPRWDKCIGPAETQVDSTNARNCR